MMSIGALVGRRRRLEGQMSVQEEARLLAGVRLRVYTKEA